MVLKIKGVEVQAFLTQHVRNRACIILTDKYTEEKQILFKMWKKNDKDKGSALYIVRCRPVYCPRAKSNEINYHYSSVGGDDEDCSCHLLRG